MLRWDRTSHPFDLMAMAARDGVVHDLLAYRDGLIVALLASRPMRRKTLAEMRLDKNVMINGSAIHVPSTRMR